MIFAIPAGQADERGLPCSRRDALMFLSPKSAYRHDLSHIRDIFTRQARCRQLGVLPDGLPKGYTRQMRPATRGSPTGFCMVDVGCPILGGILVVDAVALADFWTPRVAGRQTLLVCAPSA